MPDSTASQRALESAYAGFSHGLQDFCTPSAMSQKGGELTFPGLLTALTLTAMGRLPKVLLTINSARGGLTR
jgi:hypothetical protein